MARKRSKRASKTSAAKGKRKGKARAAPTERRAQPKGMINAWEDDPAAGAQPSGGPVIQSAGSSVRKPLARRGSQSGALKNSSETLSSNANSLCGQNSAGFPEIGATFKGIFCADVSEFESSLSGGLVSSTFRLLRRCWFRCHSQGPRFSSGSALWPSHDGIRRMRWTNLTIRPCRKSYGRYQTRNGLASSIVPAGTSFHRSAEFRFSPRVLLCAPRYEATS
jgi:hypothetical protein